MTTTFTYGAWYEHKQGNPPNPHFMPLNAQKKKRPEENTSSPKYMENYKQRLNEKRLINGTSNILLEIIKFSVSSAIFLLI